MKLLKERGKIMGLDMFLTKEIYIGSNYDFRDVKGVVYITVDNEEIPINLKKISTITEDVVYWRKANAIHKWFVDNVQDGEDDCKEYTVSREQLEDLVKLCKKVLKNRDKADELLPTQSGFFFGGTLYDKYYFAELEKTAKVLSKSLKEKENKNCYVTYRYTSSW